MSLKNIFIGFIAVQFLALPILFILDSQFLQSVLVLVIGVGLTHFFIKKYFKTNLFEVINLDKVSSFKMDDMGGGHYSYTVRPARISRRVVVFSLIVAVIPTLLFVYLAPLFIGLGFFCLSICMRGSEFRKLTQIDVMPESISIGTLSFAKDDITDVYSNQLFDQGVAVTVSRNGDVHAGNGFLYSLIWDKQADSSYEISLRTKKSSDVYVLVGGLNSHVAHALGQDLSAHIFNKKVAA